MGIKPPGLEEVNSFDELTPWMQAKMIAFSQITDYESNEKFEMLLKVIAKMPIN